MTNAAQTGGTAAPDLMTLKLRALLARADGDSVTLQTYASQYREMADLFGFEAHLSWARAFTEVDD
jgi:hypothetical protein